MPKATENQLITNLSGGINVKTNPLLLKDTECELIVNYHLDRIGSLTKRNGYDVFASQPVAAKRILGLYQYTNTATPAETTQVMVGDNVGNTQAVIYYNNAGTWTLSKNDTYVAAASITNFNRFRFTTFIDYLFRVNGRDVVGSSINVNGATWGTTNCPGTIIPSFIDVFTDRVYVARNGVAEASRVYFSSLPNAAGTAITWDTTNDYFDVNPDDGDEITGIQNNGTHLLIFKNRAFYRWSFGFGEADKKIGVGTESQESIKTNLDLGITFFANSNGVYAYTGDRPTNISRKIQPWIDAVPAADWNDVAAEVDSDHYYLYLSDSMTVSGIGDDGSDRTFTNVMAVYTISLDAWAIYSLNAPWRVAAKLIQSGAENIYFGSSNGRTYDWNKGLTDDSGGTNSDTAVEVSGEIITKEYLLNFPGKTVLKYIDILSQHAYATSAFYQMDRKGDFISFAQLKKRFLNSKNLGAEGRSLRIKLTDTISIASRIDGFNIGHIPQSERD